MHRPAARRLLALALLVSAFGAALPVGAQAAEPPAVERVSGTSRIETAAKLAATAYLDGASTVVVARADAYADALAGGPLAATLGAPILLTTRDRLDEVAAAEIRRLGASTAVLLGGNAALGAAVEDGLRAAGVTDLQRIAGPDRYDTASRIAAVVTAASGAGAGAYLTEGANADPNRGWPDALAVSPLAAFERRPVLLTASGELPAATAAALAAAGGPLTVVGGTAAVSDAVLDAAGAHASSVERVAGASRYETAARLLDRAEAAGMPVGTVWVASGASWADALVAGPAAARDGVLVLTDPRGLTNAPATAAWLAGRRAQVRTVRLVGGAASLSPTVEAQLRELLAQGTLPTPSPAPAPVPPPSATPPSGQGPGRAPTYSDVQPHDAGPAEPVIPAGAKRWSDPDTWGGRVPVAGQDVVVPAGRAVVLDVDPPALGHVRVEGELYLEDSGDRVLRAASILVTGRFSAGSASRPFTHRAEIVLDGADSDNVAGMGAHVLGVRGGILDLHGAGEGPTWTRLAATATPASTRISLAQPVAWRAGDRIVLAATDLTPDHAEEATIAAVDGTTVTLTAPLQHTHWATSETYGGRTLEQRAEVGLLSHPIVVRGADDAQTTGMGGQIRVETGSTARLSRVELSRMGQAGVMGRYPFHFHLMGSAPASYLRDSSVHHSANRCVTVHGTLDALVANVVAHDSQGHCFFMEDGVETGNRFYCNLGMGTRKPADGKRLLDSDQTPATFWISNPTNDFVGNAAAGADGNGFWYDLPDKPTGSFTTSSLRPRSSPMGTFADNVAHSNRSTGWKTGNGLFIDEYQPEGTPVIRDFSAWRNGGFGVWNEHTRLEGASLGENGTGFLGRRATLTDALVVGQSANGAERQWSQLGVAFYVDASHIEDVHFANFRPQQGKGPMRALGHHSVTTMSRPSVARLSFENADVLQIGKIHESELHRSVYFADLDGSVAGAPAVLTTEHPLLSAPGCRAVADLPGVRACPADDRFGFLRVGDRNGVVALEPATITRADGLTAAVNARDHDGSPQVMTTVRLDQRYRLAFGNETPAQLSVVLAGTEHGWAEVTIPWTGPAAFVYRPWDRTRLLPAASSASAITDAAPWFFDLATRTVTLRMRVDSETAWAMADVCRTPGCA